jgi:integrase
VRTDDRHRREDDGDAPQRLRFYRRQALSNTAFQMASRRMGRHDVTAHGFRDSSSDWCAERTGFAREVVEMALVHTIENNVEAFYCCLRSASS